MMLMMEMILRFLLIMSSFLGEFFILSLTENFIFKTLKLRVCPSPSHIEARTVNDKISWLGTDAVLIYDTTPKPAAERNWAYGISREFG